MTFDYIIIGQGIAGSLLAWFLKQEGRSVLVIDEDRSSTASKVAAGIINPVTGRRYSTTWKADELHPFAWKTYSELGSHFSTQYCFKKDIVEFFPNPDARTRFVDRVQGGNPYLDAFPDQNRFNDTLHYDFGCGQIGPAYVTSLALLLADIRKWLTKQDSLRGEPFAQQELTLTEGGVQYRDVAAGKIIFCDGPDGAENSWFRLLPFALNKGEALIIECPDLPDTHLFKKGFLLAPMSIRHHFWAGSNYSWDNLDEGPTSVFLQQTKSLLDGFLKLPYTIVEHRAAVRPATVERRPFVGLHPLHPQIGILNGLGTKGTSLAPYFASQLARHLLHGAPIAPEADVKRFERTLAR